MNFPPTVQSGHQTWTPLPPTQEPPSQLDRSKFSSVKFWTRSSWNAYERDRKGGTNGNAKKGNKRGRPEKETPDDDGNSLEPNTTHIYLEGEDGTPVSKALIMQQGQKLRSIWTTLNMHGLAPAAWSDAASFAVRFVESSILNDPRFCYLRLCDDNWKLNYWIAKNYPSWVRNHLAPAADKVVKAKRESLDNKDLIKIAPDPSDDDVDVSPDPSDGISHEESLEVLEDIMVRFFFLSHVT